MYDIIPLLLFSLSAAMGLYFDPDDGADLPEPTAPDSDAPPETVSLDTLFDSITPPDDAPSPDDRQDTSSPDPEEPVESVPPDVPAPEEQRTFVLGTEGDDLISLPGDETDGGFPFDRITVRGLGGNDIIRVAATNSDIFGGDGDDRIDISSDDPNYSFAAAGSDAFGGAGNDTLSATLFSSDPVDLFGGDGDDIIDGRRIENGRLEGGAGNDTILTGQADQVGAGYSVRADGGAGDDRLIFEGSAQYFGSSGLLNASTLLGGEGADTFTLRFDETAPFSFDDDPLQDGDQLEVQIIGDFEPGVDRIEVEARTLNDAYEVSSARLVEDATEGTTQLILAYTADTEPDLDLIVTINATGVTFNDIDFIDAQGTTT